MKVKYRYTQANQLVQRCDYMYTPYEGPEFLDAYFSQRESMRKLLGDLQPRIGGDTSGETAIGEEIRQVVAAVIPVHVPSALRDRRPEILPAKPGSVGFVTKSLLLDLWQAFLHSAREPMDILTSWILLLVKKYETQKRLYVAYSAALKPASERYDQLENYALLASLLMYLHRVERNMKYLNSALKLNDLLSSVDVSSGGPITQLTFLGAVEAELEAVRRLAVDHGFVL